MFAQATYDRPNKTVHYVDDQGNETLYIGGSFAWRCNNPGNLAKPHSRKITTAIGLAQRTSDPKTVFLIFPDADTGRKEKKRLILEVYSGHTLETMMYKYAPPNENDTEGYIDFLVSKSGISRGSSIGKLSEAQLDSLCKAIEKREGYVPGKIVQMGKPAVVQLVDKTQQPLADQAVKIVSEQRTAIVKTDANGWLPPLPPVAFGGSMKLFVQHLEKVLDEVGEITEAMCGGKFRMTAPHAVLQTVTRQHKKEEKTPPKVHIVKEGESLSGIASIYGVSVEALAAANEIKNVNKIFPRQHLRIPSDIVSPQHSAASVSKVATPAPAIPNPAVHTGQPQAQAKSESSGGQPMQSTSKSAQSEKHGQAQIQQQRTVSNNHPVTLAGGRRIITFEKNAVQHVVTEYSKNLIREIMEEVGLSAVTVTSTIRTPRDQARIMFENKQAKNDIHYKWAGQQVEQVYYELVKKISPMQVQAAMTQKIYELARTHPGVRVSNHCVTEEIYATLNVLDLSFKGVPEGKRMELHHSIQKRINSKTGPIAAYITPKGLCRQLGIKNTGEPAFHIEIMQPLK